jgi:hypothetical protein
MGGAALMIACRNPTIFSSMSAIAPRCSISSPKSLLAVAAMHEYFIDPEEAKQFDCVEAIRLCKTVPPGLVD